MANIPSQPSSIPKRRNPTSIVENVISDVAHVAKAPAKGLHGEIAQPLDPGITAGGGAARAHDFHALAYLTSDYSGHQSPDRSHGVVGGPHPRVRGVGEHVARHGVGQPDHAQQSDQRSGCELEQQPGTHPFGREQQPQHGDTQPHHRRAREGAAHTDEQQQKNELGPVPDQRWQDSATLRYQEQANAEHAEKTEGGRITEQRGNAYAIEQIRLATR
jgi:hypothetical protein